MSPVPPNHPKGIFGHLRYFVTNLFRKEPPSSSPPAYTAPRVKESEEIIQFRRSINTLLQKIDTTLSQSQEKATDVHQPEDPWQNIDLTPKQNKPHIRVKTFNPRRFSPPSLYDLFKAREAQRNAEEVRRQAREAQQKKHQQTQRSTPSQSVGADYSPAKKENWEVFSKILAQNGIKEFYHFTDWRNIASIKQQGGLCSWQYCQQNNIDIPASGSDTQSRRLDRKYNLEDYVRLSFCKNHPMKHVARQEGRIGLPVLLKIDIEVAYWQHTRFSDMNATKTGHQEGPDLKDLRRVNFYVVKQPDHFNIDYELRSYYQAEVMVKTFIPLKYIKNINEY